MIRQIALPTCTLAGDTGAAAGTATSTFPIAGELLATYVNYTGGTSTEDVTLATVTDSRNLLVLTDNQTDGWYYPRAQVHSTAGAALTLDGTRTMCEPIPICDYVKVVVAQGGTAGNTVDVWLVVRT